MDELRPAHTVSLATLIIALLIGACGAEPNGARDLSDVVVVAEAFETPRDTTDNVDSPAVWHGQDGEHWLISTAKETDVLLVHDAASGELIRRVGGEGTEPGQLDRPNGVAVVDDLALVVERDNKRVQVFRLPEFKSVGFVGKEMLRRPYGLAVVPSSTGAYDLWITDNYEDPGEQIPADSLLDQRVHQFRLSIGSDSLSAEHVRAIGPTSGDGRLRVVESIFADPANGRLLIAEEEEGRSHIKIFTQEGEFAGEVIDQKYFPNQAEGIALYACSDGAGYWLSTDQGYQSNTFHVFDRRTLEHAGSFAGETTMNTDGIALTQRGFGPFPNGAFYAVHDDQSVAAFSWSDIAAALDLRDDCTSSDI